MIEAIHFRAWEAAYALSQDFPAHLTPAQHIAVTIAVMRGPERAELECIALAAQVIGVRT